MLNQELKALNELDERIRKKIEYKRRELGPATNRYSGYKEAMLSVLSMIHEIKERENK